MDEAAGSQVDPDVRDLRALEPEEDQVAWSQVVATHHLADGVLIFDHPRQLDADAAEAPADQAAAVETGAGILAAPAVRPTDLVARERRRLHAPLQRQSRRSLHSDRRNIGRRGWFSVQGQRRRRATDLAPGRRLGQRVELAQNAFRGATDQDDQAGGGQDDAGRQARRHGLLRMRAQVILRLVLAQVQVECYSCAMTPASDNPIELVIEKLVTGGRGLGRHEGRAVFVPRTAPGDRIRVQPARSRKGYQEATLLEVLAAGPGRRAAPCPHYDECGGCDLQHLDDATQDAARRDILLDCFGRLGNLTVADRLEAADPVPVLGYRNRLRLTVHPTGPYGLKRRNSAEVVPISACPIMAAPFAETILPWLRFLPPVEQIVVRLDGRGGWLLSLYGPVNRQRALKRLLDETPDGSEPAAGLQGVLLNNRPQWGRTYLVLHVGGFKFRVSHQSFFQGNLAAAEAALRTVRGWLDLDHPAGGDLADLYGGVGLFTLGLADRFDRVLCVDSDPSAVLDARENVRRAPAARDKAVIREGEVQAVLADPDVRASLAWERACVVVDPPRAGLGKSALAALADLKPRTVIYLSCDPATLARDCAALVAAGYHVRRLRPVAMFPQTAHLETLVHLARD